MGVGNVGGALFGGINAYQQNRQAEDEARFNSRIASYNADIARNRAIEERDLELHNAKLRRRDASLALINAQVALESAIAAEGDVRRDVRRFRSALRAGAAAAGLRVDEGSALEADLEAARLGEYHALKAGFGYRMAEFAHEEDSKLFANEAQFHEQRAQYLTEHGIQAAGALLDLSAKYYKQWANYYDNPMVIIGQISMGIVAGYVGSNYQLPQFSRRPQTEQTFDRGSSEDAFQAYRRGERADYSQGASRYDYPAMAERPTSGEFSGGTFSFSGGGTKSISAWGYM